MPAKPQWTWEDWRHWYLYGTEQDAWHAVYAQLIGRLIINIIIIMLMVFSFIIYKVFPTLSTFSSLTYFPFCIINSLKVEIISVAIEFPIVLPANFCMSLALRRCLWPWSLYDLDLLTISICVIIWWSPPWGLIGNIHRKKKNINLDFNRSQL